MEEQEKGRSECLQAESQTLLICNLRKGLEVLSFSKGNSNFRTRMSGKGETEPGWRVFAGCVPGQKRK